MSMVLRSLVYPATHVAGALLPWEERVATVSDPRCSSTMSRTYLSAGFVSHGHYAPRRARQLTDWRGQW